jgi:chromosome segregation ATPase
MRAEIDHIRSALQRFSAALSDLAGKLDEVEQLPAKIEELKKEQGQQKLRLVQMKELAAAEEARLGELKANCDNALALMKSALGKVA